jgi:hypothetical protein
MFSGCEKLQVTGNFTVVSPENIEVYADAILLQLHKAGVTHFLLKPLDTEMNVDVQQVVQEATRSQYSVNIQNVFVSTLILTYFSRTLYYPTSSEFIQMARSIVHHFRSLGSATFNPNWVMRIHIYLMSVY